MPQPFQPCRRKVSDGRVPLIPVMADQISVWLIIKAHSAQNLVLAGYLQGRYLQKGLSFYYNLFCAIADPNSDLSKPDPELLS